MRVNNRAIKCLKLPKLLCVPWKIKQWIYLRYNLYVSLSVAYIDLSSAFSPEDVHIINPSTYLVKPDLFTENKCDVLNQQRWKE